MRSKAGHAFLESLLVLPIATFVLSCTITLVMAGLGQLVLTRWAALNDFCLAEGQAVSICEHQALKTLSQFQIFQNLNVTESTSPHHYSTTIQARVLWFLVSGRYDMGASEFAWRSHD